MPSWPKYFMLLVFSTTFVCAAEGSEQPPLPTELAVIEGITMTDADEAYVSGSLQHSKFSDQRVWTLGLDAAYGLTDRLRLSAGLPYLRVEPNGGSSASGIGDVDASLRYAAIDYRHKPFGLDVGLGLVAPSGDESQGLGEGTTRVEPSLTAAGWLGPVNLQLHLAWAHAVDGSGEEPRDAYEYNFAVLRPVGKGFLVLEGNGETAGGQTSYYVTPELVWNASEHVEWRVAAPIGVTEAAGDYGVIVGCTIELEHLFHRGGAGN